MNAVALKLSQINHGWAITLTDGRELARFTGLGAKRRALRYLASGRATQDAGPRGRPDAQ